MIFRNTLAQSGNVVLGYALSFILGPILLARLGLAAFGLWAVTGALISYVGLADLGIRRSLSRFVALYESSGDERGLQECLVIGLGVALGTGAVACGIAVVAAPLVQETFGVLSVHDTRLLLLCASAMLTGELISSVLTSVPIGFRKMVSASVAGMVSSVLNFSFSLAALILDPTLVTYALANAAASLVAIGPSFVVMHRVWRGARLVRPARARTREIVVFSLKNQVGRVTDLVNFQTDKIIVGALVDIRVAGAFEIASRVVMAVRSLAIMTVWALIPTVTAAITLHGRQVIETFYRHYTPYTVALSFPMFALAAASAPYLLTAWLGELPPDSVATLVVLSVAQVVNLSTGVADAITVADGRPGVVARYLGFSALLNVALTLLLAPLFGLWGVLAGTAIALTATALMFIARFHRMYGLPIGLYARSVLPSAALATVLALPLAAWTVLDQGTGADRGSAALVLCTMTALYGAAYWLVASGRGLLPRKLTAPWVRRPVERLEGSGA